jgi:hypothetical protein
MNADKSPTPSPAAAFGGLIVFVGLWLLFMGISEYHGGSSLRSMARDTILEGDPDSIRVAQNAMEAGAIKALFGILALVIGGAIASRSAGAEHISAAGAKTVIGAPTTAAPVTATTAHSVPGAAPAPAAPAAPAPADDLMAAFQRGYSNDIMGQALRGEFGPSGRLYALATMAGFGLFFWYLLS